MYSEYKLSFRLDLDLDLDLDLNVDLDLDHNNAKLRRSRKIFDIKDFIYP